MNLYRIFQDVHTSWGTYDSAVVAAEDSEIARQMSPSSGALWINASPKAQESLAGTYGTWAKPENVGVLLIGTAAPNVDRSVICASFNAG